jgi:protein SCO1/2
MMPYQEDFIEMTRIYAWLAIGVVVAGLAGTWFATQFTASDDRFAQCRSGAIAGGADQIGGPFELINAQGETVTDADVITEPTLIYFGYTFCPDVCPFDTARNADAIDVLAERGVSATPVFISIDPQRDTPEVVGDFAYNLHEKMIGLTGSPEQVKAASEAYRTYYKAHPAVDDYYLVDHSTFTYLVLPDYGFVEFFRRDVSAEDMARSVACFADAA